MGQYDQHHFPTLRPISFGSKCRTEVSFDHAENGFDLPALAVVFFVEIGSHFPAGDFACPDGTGVEDLSALTSCWLETVQAKADINDDDAVDFGDVLRLSQNWLLVNCDGCNGADITDDGNVNELDLSLMIEQWLMIENAGCRMMDLNDDGQVDLADWAVFAGNWMEGV